MFNFCSLYSGSTGNCLFIQSNESRILIDAGVSQKKIMSGLASFNITFDDIDAILVTHEHTDHIQNVGSLSKKYDIPVYCNLETLNAMPTQKEKIKEDNQKIFKPNQKFKIKDLEIEAFQIPHDAANPCGFNIFHDDKKISIATDIGHMDNNLLSNLKDSSFILLEANYDPDILKYSKYPFHLKQRILGPTGHLSNETSGKTISALTNSFGLKSAMLGHLSKENNFPELALKTVTDELKEKNITSKDISIDVAPRNCPSKLIKI